MRGSAPTPRHARSTVRRRRVLVLVLAVVAAAVKVVLAATTLGTADVATFTIFANAVREYGPIDIYGAPARNLSHYNHPPLTGWMLAGLNWFRDQGLSFPLLIRLPAVLADIATAALAFELIRRRRPLGEATLAGAAVACSPVLIVVSGFHGNTDPVFVMFALLSFYLLFTDRSGFLAGVSFAAAVSIKLVPVVALPLLLLVAGRVGWRRLAGFVCGGMAIFLLLWVPVVLSQWGAFQHKVLQYPGWGRSWWGVPELVRLAGASPSAAELLTGPGRFVMLALAATAPLVLAWRRPHTTVSAFGLTLATFLLLSTASATQYLVWGAAASVLAGVWAGGVYNAAAGAFLVVVYNHWNNAPPWEWSRAFTKPITPEQGTLGLLVWSSLLATVAIGYWPLLRRRSARPPADDEGRTAPGASGRAAPASAATSGFGAT